MREPYAQRLRSLDIVLMAGGILTVLKQESMLDILRPLKSRSRSASTLVLSQARSSIDIVPHWHCPTESCLAHSDLDKLM